MIRRAIGVYAALRDGEALDRAIVASHRRVILRHRQSGVPLAIWREGQVVEVAAESVELPEMNGGPDPTRGEG